ncbi:hypothetical protein JAAARDRAFT_67935 [Jaapia argillacea MUCL 33604]|uniref:Alpha/beta hydrolase fold-3 domain-containing protein n=1 Tax=Jaapia argillacea MUCL 33604 TaxID=933084 RepID=A0A067QCT5_9AGAM|nr:hypothetical protein JAAARDRAFT_67935 [Jaapia argillacea MUCL 33604]
MSLTPPFSPSEKVALAAPLLVLFGKILFTAIIAPFRGQSGAPTYYKHVYYAVLRGSSEGPSVRQLQYIRPPTDEAYATWCQLNEIKPRTEVLVDGTKAHWLGDKYADNVLVYFHGGGFVLPATEAYFQFLWETIQKVKWEGREVAVLLLSYDLAPGAQYPRQLQQAVTLLHHLIHNLHKDPSNIILAGDSAGGNLTLAILSHIIHPHPSSSIPELRLSKPLRGAILISPWVSFSTTAHSFTRNYYRDGFPPAAVTSWSSQFLGSSPTDPYNEPSSALPGWWQPLAQKEVINEVLIVSGEQEMLVDDIRDFTTRFKKDLGGGTGPVVVQDFVVEGEAHAQPITELEMGYKEPGKESMIVREWICSRLEPLW